MNSLYTLALRQSQGIQNDLVRMEKEDASASLQGQITASLAAFSRTTDDYENMARREMILPKQEKAMKRVAKFKDDLAELRSQFQRLKGKQEASNRADLFAGSSSVARSPHSATFESPFSLHGRRTSTFDSSMSPPNAYGGGAGGVGGSPFLPNGDYRAAHAMREHTFLSETETQLDGFLAQGREVLNNLVEQRHILKGTQRRLLDAANTIGLSRDVINWIERRSTQDNILFAAGAIFTLGCFWFIYQWLG